MEQQNQTIPKIIMTTKSPYDYWAWWLWLELKGKNIYGPWFQLHHQDAEVILKLLIWCVQDKENAPAHAIELHKGIMLAGGVGCGKTSLMNIVRHILSESVRHRMKPCREIAFDYARDGYETLMIYGKQSFQPISLKPINLCFDDLGLEPDVSYYGNACNTMQQILLTRYDYYIHTHMLTHVTTNLNSTDIEERYGKRVRSRCREMFNLISFPADSPEKRK